MNSEFVVCNVFLNQKEFEALHINFFDKKPEYILHTIDKSLKVKGYLREYKNAEFIKINNINYWQINKIIFDGDIELEEVKK